ncbi:MAG: hypothetical protein JST39_22025 [Bacteroidetes bacterium]|nr:hypothetical protein [Bacteroidota bacterium]
MIKDITARSCIYCRKTLKGRTDKKFCDDSCRNNYNNQLKGEDNNYVRNVNNALRKNRRIIASLLEGAKEGKLKIQRDRLTMLGFAFQYFTHTYTNKEGKIYCYCYEYGYLPLDDNLLLLVRKTENPGHAGV